MKIQGPLVAGVRTAISLLERWRIPLLVAAGIILFLGAAWIRMQLPATVLFNPDSWGYIGPAIKYQESGVFAQTHGRNFFYPAMLQLGMLGGKDVNYLAGLQHTLGIAAGGLWLLLWLLWARGLPQGWVRGWAAPILGLAATAVFLFNGMGLIFEHHIRPEGMFPFFAVLQLLFLGAALRFAIKGRNDFSAGAFAAVGTVAVLAAVALKPSWTLTLGTLPFLMALVFVATRQWRAPLRLTVGMLIGCGIWFSGIRLWQGALQWKPDASSGLFLPQSLVSVHADLILKTMASDTGPANFREELALAFAESKQRIKPYENLGFNPDTIFYETPVFRNLPGSVEEKKKFLFSLYFDALRENPGAMAEKWLRQFGLILFPERKWIYRRDYQLRRDFERSAADLRLRAQWEDAAVAARLLEEAKVADETALPLEESTRLTVELNRDMIDVIRFLVPLGVFLSFCAGVWALFSGKYALRTCALEGFLWVGTFLSGIATVAVVHSFDIDRYAEILNFMNLLMAGFAAVFVLIVGSAVFSQHGHALLSVIGLERKRGNKE